MAHELFIAISSTDFSRALNFVDRAYQVFGSAIKIGSTGMKDKDFGGFFQFNDVRCIPALFDLAKIFAE